MAALGGGVLLTLFTATALASSPAAVPLFSKGELNVTEYRIPLLLAVPQANPLTPAILLAFAEARLPCVRSCGKTTAWGDSSPKHVAFRRSVDGGKVWSSTRFIVKSDGTNDNLNLGNVVYDAHSGMVILQWGGCVHCSCVGDIPKPNFCNSATTASAIQLTSTDAGLTWAAPADISSQILSAGSKTLPNWPIFKFGEGQGVQTTSGDLVVCGRISSLGNDACPGSTAIGGDNCGPACILSSDGGAHWKRGGHITSSVANECEPSLLHNGSIVLNMRAGTGRFFARSDDGGKTFVQNWTWNAAAGSIANCQGSMISMPMSTPAATTSDDDMLYFTVPFGSSSRQNLSLAISSDAGRSWEVKQQVHSGPSAYSALAYVHSNCAALLFEGGDKHGDRYDHIYFTPLGACANHLAAAW